MEALQRGFEQTGVTQLHEKYICATIKLLHIVVMTTLGQCRSGFKRLQNDRRRWSRKGGVTEADRRGDRWRGESHWICLEEICQLEFKFIVKLQEFVLSKLNNRLTK